MTTTAVSTSKTLNVAGIGPVELTVEDRGDGQPFLLLHGGAGPQSVAAFAQLLAEKGQRRVLTPTHPGFGGTPRPDGLNSVSRLAALYGALLDDLGLEDVTVIGNSVGGWIAAELALLGSPRISGIVLLDAVGIEVEGPRRRRRLRPIRARDPGPLVPRPVALPCRSRHHPRRPEGDHGCQRRGLGRLCRLSGDGRPYAARPPRGIAVPTLVLWGESDRIVDPAYGQAYAAAIHGARFEMLPATGHMPQMETPDLVLEAISGWGDAPNRSSSPV